MKKVFLKQICIFLALTFFTSPILTGCGEESAVSKTESEDPNAGREQDTSAENDEPIENIYVRKTPEILIADSNDYNEYHISNLLYDIDYPSVFQYTDVSFNEESITLPTGQTIVATERRIGTNNAEEAIYIYLAEDEDYQYEYRIGKDSSEVEYFRIRENYSPIFPPPEPTDTQFNNAVDFLYQMNPDASYAGYTADILSTHRTTSDDKYILYLKKFSNNVLTDLETVTLNKDDEVIGYSKEKFCDPKGIPSFTEEEYLAKAEAKIKEFYEQNTEDVVRVENVNYEEHRELSQHYAQFEGAFVKEYDMYAIRFRVTFDLICTDGTTRTNHAELFCPYGKPLAKESEAVVYNPLRGDSERNEELEGTSVSVVINNIEFEPSYVNTQVYNTVHDLYLQRFDDHNIVSVYKNTSTGYIDRIEFSDEFEPDPSNHIYYTDDVDYDTAAERALQTAKKLNPLIDITDCEINTAVNPEGDRLFSYRHIYTKYFSQFKVSVLIIDFDEHGNMISMKFEHAPYTEALKNHSFTGFENDIYKYAWENLGKNGKKESMEILTWSEKCIYIEEKKAYAISCVAEFDIKYENGDTENLQEFFCCIYDYDE